MKRRIVSFVLIAAMLCGIVALFSGCKKEEELPEGYYNIAILFPGFSIESDYKYHQQVEDAINEKLYQDLGFKVTVTPTSYIDQYETMFALDLAQKTAYDFMRSSNGALASYAEKGVLHDLRPLIDEYAPWMWDLIPEQAWAECTLNGMIYGIPTCSFPISYGMWFRGDWLEKLGKEKPTNLAELEALCQAILDSKELNPDGKVVPMAGHREVLEQVFLGMFTEHPGDYVDENGKVQPKYFDPGYRDFVEKMAEWYQKGYIDDLVLNGDENTINNLMAQNIVGIHVANVYQLEYSTMNSYNTQNNMKMQWSIPFPADTKTYYSSGFGSDIIAFPVTGKNTEKAFQYFAWYYNNEENCSLVLQGVEGLTYTRTTDPETGKEINNLPEAEQGGTATTHADLMGFFGMNCYTELQLKYTFSSRPAESARAYDSCNTQEVMQNCHLDVTKYFQVTLPTDIGTKSADAKAFAISTISDMIVGKIPSNDATWAQFRADWEALGGAEAYDYFTGLYNDAKGDLGFLQQ